MLAFLLLSLTAAFLAGLTVILLLSWYKQNPEAQLRKRLHDMIDAAEAERAKRPRPKRNLRPEMSTASDDRNPRNVKSLFERLIKPILRSVEERLQKYAPSEIKAQLEDKIFRAGKLGIWDVRRLVMYWAASVVIVTIVTVFAVKGMMLHPLQQLFLVGLGIFMGAGLPFAILNSKIRQRQKQIRRQLPEFLDLLCVSVQAGLSFEGAVGKMLKRMKGPLIDEFRRAQNDVALGMTHQYALTNLAKRCDLEEVYLFTTSVIQAEKLGTSMARTLKLQADNMRERHRQYVKGEALKAPVKIIFPMVLFIFPSMFVVLLFPAMLMLIRSFSNN